MLRINSGWAKSLALKTDVKTRPTKGIARQALFDILRPLIADRIFIDLFAGSGLVGLEALANGACAGIFVEREASTMQILRSNIKTLRLNADKQGLALGEIACYRLSVNSFLRRYRFDEQVIVWADPPYDDCEHWGAMISAHLQTKSGSYLCFEHSIKSTLNVHQSWQLLKSKHYGRTVIDFFRKRKKED